MFLSSINGDVARRLNTYQYRFSSNTAPQNHIYTTTHTSLSSLPLSHPSSSPSSHPSSPLPLFSSLLPISPPLSPPPPPPPPLPPSPTPSLKQRKQVQRNFASACRDGIPKSNQTRQEQHHNTFIPSLHLVPLSNHTICYISLFTAISDCNISLTYINTAHSTAFLIQDNP